MSNPALELHTLYDSWRSRIAESTSPQTMTAHLKPATAEGIAEIRQAYTLLSTIDGVLRRLSAEGRNVGVFEKQLDGWARVPLSLTQGWGANVKTQHLISETTLQQIEGFSAYLEDKVLLLSDAHHANLRSLIDRADVLLTAEGLDPALQHYFRRLISEIRFALDDETAGVAFDFSEAVQRLWVAFNAAAERAPEAQKSGWRDLVEQVFIGVVSGGTVEAASIVIGSITTGA